MVPAGVGTLTIGIPDRTTKIPGWRWGVPVTQAGMQRVSYEELLSAGLDLTGVSPDSIAVTLKGEAVRRRIEDGSRQVALSGPVGTSISGAGARTTLTPCTCPTTSIALRQIHRWPGPHAGWNGAWMVAKHQALEPRLVNDDEEYNFANATADPWDAAMLRYPWGPLTYSVDVSADEALVPDAPGRVDVVLTGLTDFPGADYRITVCRFWSMATRCSKRTSAAIVPRPCLLPVPSSVLTLGNDTVTVGLPGGTATPYDIVTVDTVTLWYPRKLVASTNRILVQGDITGSGLLLSGFTTNDLDAYATDDSGRLTRLRVVTRLDSASGRWDAVVPAVAGAPGGKGVQYWISSRWSFTSRRFWAPWNGKICCPNRRII